MDESHAALPPTHLRIVQASELERLERRRRQLLDRLTQRQRTQLRRLFQLGERVELAGVHPKHSTPEDWESMTGLMGVLAARRQRRRVRAWHGTGIAHVQLVVLNPRHSRTESQYTADRSPFMVPIRFDLWHVRELAEPLVVNPRFRNYHTGPYADPRQAQRIIHAGHPDSRVQFYEEFRFAAVRCEIPARCAWWVARLAELDFFEGVLTHPPLLHEVAEVVWRHALDLGVEQVARLFARPVEKAMVARYRQELPPDPPSRQRGHLRLVE